MILSFQVYYEFSLISVYLGNDFDHRIANVFLQFDNYGNKTVSVTDLPIIVRGLGIILLLFNIINH